MHVYTQYPNYFKALTSLMLVSLVGLFIQNLYADTPVSSPSVHDMAEYYVPSSMSSFGYPVSGIVDSQDLATVRAQVSGVVRSRMVREGDVVEKGGVLIQQDVPLLSERMELQDAQNTLTRVQHDSNVITQDGLLKKAILGQEVASSTETETIRDNQTQTENSGSLLVAQIHGSITALVTALDFIDIHESKFSSVSLKSFRETIGTLYGSSQTYFNGNVTYNLSSHDDVLGTFDAMIQSGTPLDISVLLQIAKKIDQELDAVRVILVQGESDFFDTSVISKDDPEYTAYITYRSDIVAAQTNLRTRIASARSVEIANALHAISVTGDTKIQGITYSTASELFQNANNISLQNLAVSRASMNLLSGEYALGEPSAPFSGIVGEVFVKEGEYVSPGTPLMTLIGDGARELTVTVPYAILPYLKKDLPFLVQGKTVGFVSHFSPVSSQGNVTVIIELTDDSFVVGEALHGEIECELTSTDDGTEIISVPRSFVSFDNHGAFITTENGRKITVAIVHDFGKVMLIRMQEKTDERIQKITGASL